MGKKEQIEHLARVICQRASYCEHDCQELNCLHFIYARNCINAGYRKYEPYEIEYINFLLDESLKAPQRAIEQRKKTAERNRQIKVLKKALHIATERLQMAYCATCEFNYGEVPCCTGAQNFEYHKGCEKHFIEQAKQELERDKQKKQEN